MSSILANIPVILGFFVFTEYINWQHKGTRVIMIRYHMIKVADITEIAHLYMNVINKFGGVLGGGVGVLYFFSSQISVPYWQSIFTHKFWGFKTQQ